MTHSHNYCKIKSGNWSQWNNFINPLMFCWSCMTIWNLMVIMYSLTGWISKVLLCVHGWFNLQYVVSVKTTPQKTLNIGTGQHYETSSWQWTQNVIGSSVHIWMTSVLQTAAQCYSTACSFRRQSAMRDSAISLTFLNDVTATPTTTRDRARTHAIARPSVCLSHGWISQKGLKLGSCNFHLRVTQSR